MADFDTYYDTVKTHADEFSTLFNVRLKNTENIKFYDEANIATDLVPNVEDHIEYAFQQGQKPRIQAIGGDGKYFAKPGNMWSSSLADWGKRGAAIDYLFMLKPCETAVEFLSDLSKDAKVRTFEYQPERNAGESQLENHMSLWKTFHYVLFHNPEQLWLEADHPADSLQAYGCQYLSPGAIRNSSDVYSKLKDLYESAVDSDLVDQLI